MSQKYPHTDIHSHGFIAHLPDPWRTYARLARLDRPVGTWLLFLPGLFGIFLPYGPSLTIRLYYALLFAIGSLLMRSAGCIINDMWDRDIDSCVARTASRPLANGTLTMKQALGFLILLLLGSISVLLALPVLCWFLAPLSLLLIILYPLAKRLTWWPQLIMGFTFGFGAPMGYAASCGTFHTAFLWPGLCLYGGVILWQLGFDTVYGFQDMEDDARIGIKSSSRRVLHFARPFILCCYSGALILFDASAHMAHLHPLFLLGLLPTAWLLIRQGINLDPHDAPACLKAFQHNVLIGWILAAGFILGRL